MENEICPKTGKPHKLNWGAVFIHNPDSIVSIYINCRACGSSGDLGPVDLTKYPVVWDPPPVMNPYE